jgi:hypothetical protein
VVDCDVSDCKINGTNFNGKVLRNGVWKNGDLVGRIDYSKEVVVRNKGEVDAGSTTPRASMQMSQQPQQSTGTIPAPSSSTQRAQPPQQPQKPPAYSSLQIGIEQSPIPSRDYKAPITEDDEETSTSATFTPDSYEGPRVETPPPYEPSADSRDRDYDVKG